MRMMKFNSHNSGGGATSDPIEFNGKKLVVTISRRRKTGSFYILFQTWDAKRTEKNPTGHRMIEQKALGEFKAIKWAQMAVVKYLQKEEL